MKRLFSLDNRRGQAVAEMALFGSLILFIFGSLLSYLQQFNDQQYVQMEAFRRALEKSCSYKTGGQGAGASVQYTLIQNRRQADLSGSFMKRSPQTLSASSSVFWAIPKSQAEANSLTVYRVNQDEKQVNYRDYVDRAHDGTDDNGNPRAVYWSFEPGVISSNDTTIFTQVASKRENAQSIVNTQSSILRENITTSIPYTVKQITRGNEANPVILQSGDLIKVTQYLYRDTADGQYKYSSQAPADTQVTRARTWETKF